MLAIPYPRKAILFVLFAIVAVAAIGGAAFAIAQGQRTANVEVRVWEDVNDPERNFISARPEGGSWSTLGTIPLPLTDGVSSSGRFRYGDITLAVPLPDAPEAVALPRCLSEEDRWNRFNYNWFDGESLSDLLNYAAGDLWESSIRPVSFGGLLTSYRRLDKVVDHYLQPLLAEGNPSGHGTHDIGRHSLSYLMRGSYLVPPNNLLGEDGYRPPFYVEDEDFYNMSQAEYDKIKAEALREAEYTANRLILELALIGAHAIHECQLHSQGGQE